MTGHVPISAEARGRFRIWRAGVRRSSAQVDTAFDSPGFGVASGDFAPNFFLRLMAKDLGYALEEAGERDINLQTAAAALSVFEQAVAAGYGDQDFTAIAQLLASKPESLTR